MKYAAPWWLPGGNLQTIWPALFARRAFGPRPRFRRERWTTPDGDFVDLDWLDLERADNRHVAFGWGAHFCFGAALARIEGQIAFPTLLRRLPDLALAPGPLTWRQNLGLRGLEALPVTFQA